MKQIGFDSVIVKEDFEEEKKKQAIFLGNYLQLEVGRIINSISRSDEVIVSEYINDIKRRYSYLKKYYQSLNNNDKKMEDSIFHDNLQILNNQLNACMEWQNGNKEIDISFIPAIEHKKMFLGKSKEEIAEELEIIRENRDSTYDRKKSPIADAFDTAVRRYEPVRERVDVIRKMTYLEKQQKASFKEKLNKYLSNMSKIATFSIVPSVLMGYALRVYNAFGINNSIVAVGLSEAAFILFGAVGVSIYNKINYHRIKKDYEIAKNDLEEAGLYQEIEESLVRSKKKI